MREDTMKCVPHETARNLDPRFKLHLSYMALTSFMGHMNQQLRVHVYITNARYVDFNA